MYFNYFVEVGPWFIHPWFLLRHRNVSCFFSSEGEEEEVSNGSLRTMARSCFRSRRKNWAHTAFIHPLVSVMVCASVQESRAAVATFASAAKRHRRVQAEYDEYIGMLNG